MGIMKTVKRIRLPLALAALLSIGLMVAAAHGWSGEKKCWGFAANDRVHYLITAGGRGWAYARGSSGKVTKVKTGHSHFGDDGMQGWISFTFKPTDGKSSNHLRRCVGKIAPGDLN
ncbi:MAG: hypothetical protein F4X87_04510 [Chloroflexi bacterium]|nr:hypothetical protein [Chloroflexota bacterium]